MQIDDEYNIPEDEDEEYIPGQHKSDKELYKILHAAKQVNKEAQAQSTIAKKQTTDLNDINKVNEYSKKTVDRAERNLKKGL